MDPLILGDLKIRDDEGLGMSIYKREGRFLVFLNYHAEQDLMKWLEAKHDKGEK